MGAGPEELAPPSAEGPAAAWTGDALFALLDGLRGEGFTVGVGEYLEVQAAAAACHRDGLDGNPHRLRNYLAPVVCTNLEQQELFYRQFDTWWVDHAGGRRKELPPPPLPPPPLHESELAEVVRRTRPWKWWAASALGAAAVVAALIWSSSLAGLWRSWFGPTETTVQAPAPAVARPDTEPVDAEPGKTEPRAEKEPQTLKVRVIDLTGQPVPKAQARLATGELLALRGHEGAVRSAAFSPDGRRVVTASNDKTARVWAADGYGKTVVLRGHEYPVNSAAFSPDGKRVVTASNDKTARVWPADGYGKTMVLRGHEGPVWSAAFSPDGKRVVTASSDKTARVWAADGSGEPVVLRGHKDRLVSAAFSPDGKRIVTASADNTARVWPADGYGKTVVLHGHEGPVWSAAFSPDGKRVVTASSDKTARVWAADGSGEPVVLRHEYLVDSATFSPDGKRITTASENRTARIWDSYTGGLIANLAGHEGWVNTAAFSPDGTRVVLAPADGTARIWQAAPQTDLDPSTLPTLKASDERGEMDLAAKPQTILFTHPDHHSPPPFLFDSQAAGGNLRVELAPITLWDRLLEHQRKVQAGLALLPLALAGPWLAWRVRRRRQLVLERRTTREEQATAALSLPEPHHDLYRGARFARAWIELRRRQPFGAGDLDAEATVEASVRRLGFFTPVFRARLEVPVYLVLIDRAGFRDQRALMGDLLLDRLKVCGVDLDRYDFDRDPRRVALRGAAEVHRDLEELAGLYPNHHLTVFADGSGFTDPVTGRLAPWVAERFAAWPRKALLTPVPVCHWGRRELDLAAAGFMVLPANETGIERLADTLRGEGGVVARPLVETWQPPYPDLLAARPGRFLERHPPEEQELSDLCDGLAIYLGPDGYRWLCSLAAYPELDGYLTLYLGLLLRRLDGRAVLDEPTLLALTRLPWLRHGSMPDWLRLRLLQDLSPADDLAVREWMRQFLEQREIPGSPFRLDVARPPESETRGLRSRLQRWIEAGDWRRLIKDWAHGEPREGPLRDQIFVSFLLGEKPSRLQVLAPHTWRRWVWEQGLAALGPKTGAVFLLTAFLSILGLFLGGWGLTWLAKVSSAGQSKVTLEQPFSPKRLATLEGHKDLVTSVAFSPDGKQLASASWDGTVILWDMDGRKPLATLEGHKAGVTSVAFNPDGRRLASASLDKTVILWDVDSRKQIDRLNGHEDGVNSVAFSPDGRRLAVARWDRTVILWDVDSRKLLDRLNGHKDAVTSVAFSPDGRRLASASMDKSVILWDVDSRKLLDRLNGHEDEVTSVAFSPDGRRLASASADQTVILWDVDSRKRMATLNGHENDVASVAFSPDGRELASASWDGTVILWDVDSGKRMATLKGNKGNKSIALDVAFSPDGKLLASASRDGTVILWNVNRN